MGRFAAGECPEADGMVADAVSRIGAEIESLALPRLRGVVLGGGYGRGEGGVVEPSGGARTLSNDLDFFAIADEGAPEADTVAAIAAALGPINVMPAAVTARAKSAFSDKNPYPGCTASAPVILAAVIMASIFK